MKYCKDFLVVENEKLTASYFKLILQYPEKLPQIQPGQFVEVQVQEGKDVLLRRPISIHDVDTDKNQMSLLIQIVGKGTQYLSEFKKGEKLSVMFPLGNGFPLEGKKVLLVGGGVGIAPLLHLSREFKAKGITPDCLIGCRTKDQMFSMDDYSKVSNLYMTTEDGTCGVQGLVLDHPVLKESFDAIYTCGPTPMMKAVAKYAQERSIPCYVSLENKMACGVGACLCCVTDTVQGHKCTCTEGPVFLSTELKDF